MHIMGMMQRSGDRREGRKIYRNMGVVRNYIQFYDTGLF